jgi:hypothetical protein
MHKDIHHLIQRQTGDMSNAMLVAGAFTILHTKCLKKGLLKEFRGAFGFFAWNVGRRGLLIHFDPIFPRSNLPLFCVTKQIFDPH